MSQHDDLIEPLVQGGQGRSAGSLRADAMNFVAWFILIACLFMFLAATTGCNAPTPNANAAGNNLRHAIARDDKPAASPRDELSGSQPCNKAQKMVEEQYSK